MDISLPDQRLRGPALPRPIEVDGFALNYGNDAALCFGVHRIRDLFKMLRNGQNAWWAVLSASCSLRRIFRAMQSIRPGQRSWMRRNFNRSGSLPIIWR